MPQLTGAWKESSPAGGCRAVMQYTFDKTAQSKYGAPAVANTTVSLAAAPDGTPDADQHQLQPHRLHIDVQYHKRQTRMAESLWVSFAPRVLEPRGWRVDKLGQSIDPFDVVVNGSRAMHAVWRGLQYYEPPLAPHAAPAPSHFFGGKLKDVDTAPTLEIVSLDAPVVAVDKPSPIVFLRDQQIEGHSWHFNLFNNAWNVNYP
eukprot:COSAG02_NODE_3274_length_7030_cov_14.860008_2_plen_203_part_00